jgi:hypothetical protein
MSAFCKKHPKVELQIRQGKRNQNFVACPECRPDLFADPKTKTTPAAAPPATPAAPENKNGNPVKWYDRVIL